MNKTVYIILSRLTLATLLKLFFMTKSLVYPKIFVFVGEQEEKDFYKIINM